jgi:hypothetical protein
VFLDGRFIGYPPQSADVRANTVWVDRYASALSKVPHGELNDFVISGTRRYQPVAQVTQPVVALDKFGKDLSLLRREPVEPRIGRPALEFLDGRRLPTCRDPRIDIRMHPASPS